MADALHSSMLGLGSKYEASADWLRQLNEAHRL